MRKLRITTLAVLCAVGLSTPWQTTRAQTSRALSDPDLSQAPADPPGFVCSDRTIQGTYGVQMQGTRPVPPPTGGIETVIGVVLRTYDGAGNVTQVDNVKGSVTGIVIDRPGSGTYQVNPDCSATTLFQPAPGITIEERMVIVDFGREIRSITSSPPPIMVSTVQQRIGPR